MFRNTYQMHKDVRLLIDEHATTRFNESEIDRALNLAQEKILRDRVENIKFPKKYGLDVASRSRSEIQPLLSYKEVSMTLNFKTVNSKRTSGNPYYVDLTKGMGDTTTFQTKELFDIYRIEVKKNNVYYEAKYITQDEVFNIDNDPFLFDKKQDFYYSYGATKSIDADRSVRIYIYSGGKLTTSSELRVHYVKQPQIMKNYVTVISTASYPFVALEYHVLTALTTSGGASFAKAADESILIADNFATKTLTTGSVIRVDNSNLPGILHGELVEKAAAIILGWAENFQKNQAIEFEREKQ